MEKKQTCIRVEKVIISPDALLLCSWVKHKRNLKISKLYGYELNFHYFNLTKEQKCFQYKYTS